MTGAPDIRAGVRALQDLVEALERDTSLGEPARLRERVDAFDRLEALLLSADAEAPDADAALLERARAVTAGLEAADRALFESLRSDIRRGAGAERLLEFARQRRAESGRATGVEGDAYDYLDVLVAGVLGLEVPSAELARPEPETVPYQPTPGRHIFDLIERTALGERDVLVDLGSGLGHVALMAGICSSARCIGVELERAYVEAAGRTARALNLTRVRFVRQDARTADLSGGTVFYLYTPFLGGTLRGVLDSLREEAGRREIRVCTLGPCSPVVAGERWLEPEEVPRRDRIALFRSRA